MEAVKKYLRVLLNIVIPVFGWAIVCFVGPKILRYFLPFVIGWIIAMIANPLVKWLEKRVKIVRRHSSMLIVIVVLAFIILVLYWISSKLFIQFSAFLTDLPGLYELLLEELREFTERFQKVFLLFPNGIQEFVFDFASNIGEYLSLLVQKIASPAVTVAGNVAKGIPNALVNSVITIFSSYFFIIERDKVMESFYKYLSSDGNRYFGYLKKDIRQVIGGYFLAQFKIMFIIASILVIGFLALDVKYALLLGLLIAILDFLPLLGTGTVLIPWAVFRLVMGDFVFAGGLVLLYILILVIRQIIQPKIVGDTLGLSPFMTLLFLYLGFKIGGLAGTILAVPIGILALNLYRYGMFDSLIENVKILVCDINEFRKQKDDKVNEDGVGK